MLLSWRAVNVAFAVAGAVMVLALVPVRDFAGVGVIVGIIIVSILASVLVLSTYFHVSSASHAASICSSCERRPHVACRYRTNPTHPTVPTCA